MFGRTSLLKATALALPFSLAAAAAQAASVAETVQQNPQLSTFAKAIETAKLGQQLSGAGPFTVFAPTDQAFEQLPKDALDELMKPDNQAQLTKLIEHHVVQGKAIAADDLLGGQTQVETMSGDTLTVDGTSQVVLLVPTGLTIAQVGDQLVIQREGVAVSTHAIQVEDAAVTGAGGEQQQAQAQPQQGQVQQGQSQQQAETPVAEGSDMPVTQHQEQVLRSTPAEEERQTAPEGTDMPATEHQRQVLAGNEQQAQGQQQQAQGQQQQAQGQQQQGQQQQAQGQQQTAAETAVAEGSDMPVTKHQEEVLKTAPTEEQRQTAPEGTDMPATEHQRQVLAGNEQQAQGQQQARVEGQADVLREATVLEPDIEADNGVIHVIDAVLVPQQVLKMLETAKQG